MPCQNDLGIVERVSGSDRCELRIFFVNEVASAARTKRLTIAAEVDSTTLCLESSRALSH